MNWKELYSSWETGNTAPVYLFHGEEEYIKKSALDQLRSMLLPAGLEALNETILEGGVSTERVIEASETLPLMCAKRLVIVKDWAPLLAGKAKNEAEDAERFAKWLPNAPASNVLLFYVRGKADGVKKSVKALKDMAVEVTFAPLDDQNLARWIRRSAKEAGAAIGAEACDSLVFAAGRDLTRLSGEIGKLAAFVGKGGEICSQDVRSLVVPTTESTIFEMIDALIAGKFAAAQQLLGNLLTAGENRVRILYMITRQMRLMCLTRELLDANTPAPQMQSALGVPAFGLRRLTEQVRSAKTASLRQAYQECVDTEFAIKSGKWREEAALNRIMLILSSGLGRK